MRFLEVSMQFADLLGEEALTFDDLLYKARQRLSEDVQPKDEKVVADSSQQPVQ